MTTKKNKTEPLRLHNEVYYYLLTFQSLNLLTLVRQLHTIYLLFAVAALVLQFVVHFKIARRSTYSSDLTQTNSFYAAPKILPSWLIFLFAITGCIGIALAGRELGLLLSMIHLLCFAYSLKMFEIPQRKDLYQLVVLGIFVACSSLIFIQSIYFSLAVIVLVFSNFIIILNLFTPKQAMKQQIKLLSKLCLYSVPFAIVLFIGFPKLSPFWQVPSVKSAKVGLSDSVKIGDIAKLALSDELAFRVSFQDQTPRHSELYWRAMVLDDFDGITWRQSTHDNHQHNKKRYGSAKLDHVTKSENVELRGSSINYQVITEPSFQSWLFALDLATSEQGNIGQRNDFSLFYRGTVNQQLSYQVSSYPNAILSPELIDDTRTLNLALTTNNNPRLLAKAQQLRQRYSDDRQLINQVLSDFNQEDYYYTLEPPRLNNNSLDEFYFDTRSGFCEHYASSFTYLMRAAGIPARMVVGYLGGELNPNGNYLTVYQRNAHAWAEVWLPGQGWQRVDPTAAVDPERVESGFSSSLMQEYDNLSSGLFSLKPLQAMWWYNQLKMQIDAIDYQWTRWVIGYDGKQQSDFLAELFASFKKLTNLLYLLAILLGLVVLFYSYKAMRPKVSADHKINVIYLRTLALMAKHKLVKERRLTAQQFAEVVVTTRPELAEHFTIISTSFDKLAYQRFDEPLSKNELNKQVKVLQRSYRCLRWQLWLTKFEMR